MAASNADKFRKVGKPGSATTLSAPGHTIGGTSITVGSTTNWSTDTGVTFAIDRVTVQGSEEVQVPGSYTVWRGTVATATTITNMVLDEDSPNSDQDYPAASTTRVYIPITAGNHNDLVDGILVDHEQTGSHDTLTDSNGNEWLERGVTASAVNHVKVTNAATGNAPKVESSGSDTNVDLLLDGKGTGRVRVPSDSNLLANINAPQGFLVNGYIDRSVASNNITVAIKTLAGTDPSSTDPVYCRIGNTVRAITAALSVTKNAGTNWFGSGTAPYAAANVDYFAFVGYNATDGVTLGFARIPYARKYGDFSTTSTDETYCAISTITNAASTDEYELVGRFSAILGVSASFNWSTDSSSYSTTNLDNWHRTPIGMDGVDLFGRTSGIAGSGLPPALTGRFLIQAGSNVVTYSSNSATINFPSTFPNGVLTVIAVNGDTAALDITGVTSTTTSSVTVRSPTASGSGRVNWIAIGF